MEVKLQTQEIFINYYSRINNKAMSDYLTQAENENTSLQSPNNATQEIKDTYETPEAPKDDFAASVFEKISKPQFAGNFDSKEELWDKYSDVYERDYGEDGKDVFDEAYKKSASYHNKLAAEELEDSQLPKVLSDFDWVLPSGDNVQRVDPSASTTTVLETNSGRLQMIDWWTDPTKSVREEAVSSNSYIDGDGNEIDTSHLNSLQDLLDTVDETGKEIIGFEYTGASEYTRGDSTLKAVYRGDIPTGELATIWDLKDSWLSNNDLTSNVLKTTVGSVVNFGMDILDTAFTLGAAVAGAIDPDSDAYKNLMAESMRTQQWSMSKSDYDQSKIFTVNNMIDMAVNTGLQLLLAGGVTKGAMALSKMITNGARAYGKKAGLFVLGGMAAKDAYDSSLKAGFTPKEASAIYFASYAAMFQANKLSNFTDDAFTTIGSRRLGNHTARRVISGITPEDVSTGNGVYRVASNIANSAAKQIKKLYSKPGLAGAMITEAAEEETELVAQEVVNHMANVYSTLGYEGDLSRPRFKTVMDEGYWEEKGWEALLSGLGGAMGGAMAYSVRRPRASANRNVSEDQWPVQGDTADSMRRLAFEYTRGTERGKVATEGFLDSLKRERERGRFGREDYSTMWNSDEGRYKRMTELSPQERESNMSQADVLYNTVIAQFNHYASLFGSYAGNYEQVIDEHPEIAGVYGEEELFKNVSNLITKKQNLLANSTAGTAPGVDAQLNNILNREDAVLDTVLKTTEAEVDRFISSREKESIEGNESDKTKKAKAETSAKGQPDEVLDQKQTVEQSVNSKAEKLLTDEINKLAGALGLGGSEMSELLDTQRKLKDIEEGKFVERGIVNTLLKSNHFRNILGEGAPKKYRQYGNFVEELFSGDLNLKNRVNNRKADGLRFTESFTDKMKGIPSDFDSITNFVDSSDLPFLTTEQKSELNSKLISSVPSVEEIKLEMADKVVSLISDVSSTYTNEDVTIIAEEGEPSKELFRKVYAGARAVSTTILEKHIDEDINEIPEKKRKDVARVLHAMYALQDVQRAQTSEDISRVTFDPSEVDLRVVYDGYEVTTAELVEQVEEGFGREFLDETTTAQKVGIPDEIKEVQRLTAKVDKAEDPLGVKEFDGEYFNKNFTLNNQGVETINQTLLDSIISLTDSAIKDDEGNITTFTDTEGAKDLKEKIAVRKAQVQLIQRAFKIIGDVRSYNQDQFVGGFDQTLNNNTFFSKYVSEMVGDPKRYFELSAKQIEKTITEEESEEFVKMLSIVGSPNIEAKSQLDLVVNSLDRLDQSIDELLSLASQSSEQLKQNYYVSTINYLNDLSASFNGALDIEDFEGDARAEELFTRILSITSKSDIKATEEGAIEALQAVTTIKTALFELGNLTLPSGKTGKDIVKKGGFQDIYLPAYTSIFYDPIKFIASLTEVIEMVGSGKDPREMKLPTVDQIVVAEQLAANSLTELNSVIKKKAFEELTSLDVNITTIEGLQGTGKTEVVAGMAASVIQKNLTDVYKGTASDHRILMCGNTDKQCVKLHDAAKRYGVHIGSIDGNRSMNQFDLYNLLVKPNSGESDEDHLSRLVSKLEGIDLILYDEASYIEFLEKFPESKDDLESVGTLNAILYQLSRVNKLRSSEAPKLSLILMGDKTQGGYMEGMRSPRNPDAAFTITGKGTLGAIGSGRLPYTNKLVKTFRFEVPSLKRDIDNFKQLVSPDISIGGDSNFARSGMKKSYESSWNVISNDDTGKLGGIKIDKTWAELCNDDVTISNIKKQLEIDPEFDLIVITNGGIESIPEGSLLRNLVNANEGSDRIEIASLYEAQGSEAAYSLVNVPNNMLTALTEQLTPESGEINIVSMAIGRAKYFSQVAISGNAVELSSTNEVEITKQSEPEVTMFRESWFRVLDNGLFSSKLAIPTEEVIIEEFEEAVTPTDTSVVLDINDPNVESPSEQSVRNQELFTELGVSNGIESSVIDKKQELNEKLKSEDLSSNERNELESTVNLLNNIDDVTTDEDLSEVDVINSLDTEDSFTNRREVDKLKLAEDLGTVVGYSGRNLAAGAVPTSIGLDYQIRDTNRIFGTNMAPEVIDRHKLSAIGHDGQGGAKMGEYEYKLITYQFVVNNSIGTNTGLFAKPKNSPGEWFMCLSFPKADTYEGDFGSWLAEQGDIVNEARDNSITKGIDITSEEYTELLGLGNKVEIVEQKGADAKNQLFAISRNIADGAIKQVIRGTTAGALETGPLYLDRLAKSNPELLDIATRVYGKTGMNILELPIKSTFRTKVSDVNLISGLESLATSNITTTDALKFDRFESLDDHKVSMLDVAGEEIPVVMVKSTRGVIPYSKKGNVWYPLLAIRDSKVLVNEDVHDDNSDAYDAEISKVANLLSQTLTDSTDLENNSTGVGHDRMNSLIATNLRYDSTLLKSKQGDEDLTLAIMNQFYSNMPSSLGNAMLPLKEAKDLIQVTSGDVTFSKPMVVRVGSKAGHSMLLYSTRKDIDLELMSSEELQKTYKTIAANRSPGDESVEELLGLNRDGIGLIWLNQRGYSLAELDNIVENTDTTLSKKLFQLSTWGNANDRLVAMFASIADVANIYDESTRLQDLLDELGSNVPKAEVELWYNKYKDTEAFNKLSALLTHIFKPASLGRVSTAFTTNPRLDDLLGVKDDAQKRGLSSAEVQVELEEYIASNPGTETALKDYDLTVEELAHIDIASKNSLSKGELVRNKKTGKPVVNYDIIRYIPSKIISSLTGTADQIDPEINLVNLFQKLNSEVYSDTKGDILAILDDLIPNVPGLKDRIYASPFISLNSKSTIEVGISPDNGNLQDDLTTSVKMVANPGVALNSTVVTKGFAFEDLRAKTTDNRVRSIKDLELLIDEESKVILDGITEGDVVSSPEAKSKLRSLVDSFKLEGEEKSLIDSKFNSSVNLIDKKFSEIGLKKEAEVETNPLKVNLIEYFNVTEDSNPELYSVLQGLDFIRENLVFDNDSLDAYVDAISSVDFNKFFEHPAQAVEVVNKQAGFSRSVEPMVPLTDTAINIKIASLDLDNPVHVDKTFLDNINPNDTSFDDWLEFKTSRPSIPHLYAMLTDEGVDETDRTVASEIIRKGVGGKGRKLRRKIIDMIETGNFSTVEYEQALAEITELEGQEAATAFSNSEFVLQAFRLDTAMRVSDDDTKLALLKEKYEELSALPEADRLEGLIQLRSALLLLSENKENLSSEYNLLLKSVQNSLNSSIISEKHHAGELTTSQLMMETFKKTGVYNKLSDEALSIFSDIEAVADSVPGLQLIHEYINNPAAVGQQEYNKAVSSFKGYLRTKTENRSVIKEFNKLISDSFCV
jgi:hypothetical protein